MKDFSFLLLKNALGSKMKKGFKSFCNGDASTSTLDQQKSTDTPPTLEEMIMQLDLEEKMARRAKLDDEYEVHHRMSCVNSSDILRSARNALNQYPRFSLDGKDSMYRSSFRNLNGRNSIDRNRAAQARCFPAKVAGESVVWCKPGVVGKLMGLEAMPIPIKLKYRMGSGVVRRRKADGRCSVGSCSNATGYRVMKPVAASDGVGWPMRRFL